MKNDEPDAERHNPLCLAEKRAVFNTESPAVGFAELHAGEGLVRAALGAKIALIALR